MLNTIGARDVVVEEVSKEMLRERSDKLDAILEGARKIINDMYASLADFKESHSSTDLEIFLELLNDLFIELCSVSVSHNYESQNRKPFIDLYYGDEYRDLMDKTEEIISLQSHQINDQDYGFIIQGLVSYLERAEKLIFG